MNHILAIDPGNTESGWVVIDGDLRPIEFGKSPNNDLRLAITRGHLASDLTVIEMVASYGMPVGAEVFETCVWIGRFVESDRRRCGREAGLVYRRDIKLHHCHSTKANDATVKRALVDRFAYGQPNYGKGTKASPGWFHGFRADIWQAYALAVYAADQAVVAAEADALSGKVPF